MFLKAVYDTNEVLGSFWRPHDYMAHVPNAKVIGTNAVSFGDAVNVSLSEAGKQMAATFSKATPSIDPIDISTKNDEHRKTKRYIYDGVEGTVTLMDIAG